MTEHGPFLMDETGQKLVPNEYSWNRVANMIYLGSVITQVSEVQLNLSSPDLEFSSAPLKHVSSSGQEFSAKGSTTPDLKTATEKTDILQKVVPELELSMQ